MKGSKSTMTANKVAVVLYSIAFMMFLLAIEAISQSDIWSFLSWFSMSLFLALGPKEPDFYKSPIRKWSDLNSITFSTDALSGAILTVAFILMVVGIVGGLFFS